MVLGNVNRKDDATYQHHRSLLMEAREKAASAFSDAEKGYTAICLLVPPAAGAVRRYLDLCNDADAYPDEKRDARERARQTAEEAIRAALGS
jgi:hypothetical protein